MRQIINNRIEPSTGDDLLTEAQAARLLQLSIYTLQAWRARCYGPPHVKLSPRGGVRYRRGDLRLWIESRLTGSNDALAP